MALAQRLNELAFANSKGRLNDDEYRLLRQNLFEQYSDTPALPVEAPIVPLANPTYTSSSSSHRRPAVEARAEASSPRSLTRRASSVTTGVTNFLRRAAGWKIPATATSHTTLNDTPTTPDDVPKQRVIPRILNRKRSILHPIRTDGSRAATNAVSDPPRPTTTALDASHLHYPPSPTRSTRRSVLPISPSQIDISSAATDLIDNGNLHTVKDIRTAIIATEAEAQRLLEAFNNLESATSYRVQQRTARRLPSATPAHANVLIEGREWRDHSFQPPPSSFSDKRSQRRVPAAIDTGDGVSIRSESSIGTTLSQSKSMSSLRRQHPSSPLSPRFAPPSPSLHRKSSLSSITSQAPSSRRLGINSSVSLSRSTGHLPLSVLAESEHTQSTVTVDAGSAEDEDPRTEVADIQRRRREVAARYEAQLAYLRARLKGAELHEKLLKQ